MIKIIPRTFALAAGIALLASPFASRPVLAQDHSQMHHEQPAKPAKKLTKPKNKKPAAHDMHSMSHENMPGMDHAGGHGGHDMKGFLGPYGMGREGSGTSWQPDTSPHEGIHAQYGE